ncbi:MAG: hypothetical protein H7A43_05775 [Verrucomicrobia bacterium]|nr:hypothetical protein [Kiritimatiellia bacterium]MCP5488140.1 hypothetical protein [Verrucomicrobiota bacterium]
MIKHTMIVSVIAGVLLTAQAGAYEIYSAKKGVGQTSGGNGMSPRIQKNRIETLRCSWYYTWGINTRNAIVDPMVEFVPMKWGGNSLPGSNTMTEDLAALFTPEWAGFTPVTHFLGFNEPEHVEQSNVSVAHALSVWPLLEAAAASNGISSIGSPGCTGADGQDGQWVTNFMTQAGTQGLQVDFMSFHSYPEPTSSTMLSEAATYYSRYGRDVWLTEFNAADWTAPNNYTHEQSYTWMAEMLHRLESTPYIKRYAIFPWDATYGTQASASHIFEIDVPSPGVTNRTAIPTPLGKLYAVYRSSDIDGPYPGVTYYLHNKGNHRRLWHDGVTPSTADVYTEGASVDFRLVDAGSGRFYIVNTDGANQRLGYDGTNLFWSSNNTGGSDLWSLIDNANGWKYIRHAGTGRRLGTAGGSALTTGSPTATADTYNWAFIRSNTGEFPWTPLVSDDFESGGWGNWVDGGIDASLGGIYSANGSPCIKLQDNSGVDSSTWLASSLDLTGYSVVTIDFSYIAVGMESGENFLLQFSADGGSTWTTITNYVSGTDFDNAIHMHPTVTIGTNDVPFTTNANIRFQCDASADDDAVFIDDIGIYGYADVVTTYEPFFWASPMAAEDALIDSTYNRSIVGAAADLDNDTLSYEKTAGPAWLTIATNGVLSGTPTAGDIGLNTFTVEVSDVDGGRASATLDILVKSGAMLVGDATCNGNFNANPGVAVDFASTPSWYNLGGAQTVECTRSNLPYDASQNAVLTSDKIFAVDTEHTLTMGERFDLRYVWRDASGWLDGVDQLSVSLFVTDDDTLFGVRSNLVQDWSGLSTVDSAYESVERTGVYTATASVAGKRLFAAIEAPSASGFARLDNFELILVGENPPYFWSDPMTVADAVVDTSFNHSIAGSAADINEDPLTYAKVGGPDWLNLAGNGVLSGTPTWRDVGTNAFTVQVGDGKGGFSTATLMIRVKFTEVLVGGPTRNGDFNANPGVAVDFAGTAAWYNLGSSQTVECTKSNLPYDDNSQNAVLTGGRNFGVDTEHAIAAGDSFDLRYVWRDAFNWVDEADQITVSLFITDDDTLTGMRSNLVQTLSGLSSMDNTYESVERGGIYTATAAIAGKRLFAAIETDASGFARLDNFELIVSPEIAPGYDAWGMSHGMTGILALATNDYDADTWNNLLEYSLAGNPTNPLVTGMEPILAGLGQSGGTSGVVYVHLQRTNPIPGLTYTLLQTKNLLNQPWSNCVDTVVTGTGPAPDSDFITVTNWIPTNGKTVEFIGLQIGP